MVMQKRRLISSKFKNGIQTYTKQIVCHNLLLRLLCVVHYVERMSESRDSIITVLDPRFKRKNRFFAFH
jgi:hypothetical protein